MSSTVVTEGTLETKRYRVSASKTTAINVGDHVWESSDSDGPIAVSVADFPWQGSLAKTRRLLRTKYLGISKDASPAGSNTPTGTRLVQDSILVQVKGEGRTSLDTAATVDTDDYVAPSQNGVTAYLLASTVSVVSSPVDAIGKVSHRQTTASSARFTIGAQKDMDVPVSEQHVADPLTAAAIPVDKGFKTFIELEIGSAGAETSTLAAASWPGQEMTISCRARGTGSRVLTVAAAINDTGNNTVTFDAAGETIVLKARANLAWMLVASMGATLSTV